MQNTCCKTGRKKKPTGYRRKIYSQTTFQGASTDGDTACFSHRLRHKKTQIKWGKANGAKSPGH